MIYADYNATTNISGPVLQAMTPYLTRHFGNPGCAHIWGLTAQEAMIEARSKATEAIGAQADELYFTSGATESNNWVLFGVFGPEPSGTLVTTAIEHPAILRPASELEKRGVTVIRVGVDRLGRVLAEDVIAACGPDTRLVSVMLANNETGVVQPVAEIAAGLAGRGIPVHTDAAQAIGKIPVDVRALGVDLLTVAGHKCHAPKGVGALFVRRGVSLHPMLFGGGQERGQRSGTENVPYAAGLGEAMRLAALRQPGESARLAALGREFVRLLRASGLDFVIHGEGAERLPNTWSIGFRGKRSGDILSGLVGLNVGVSGGAACHGSVIKPSYVLEAMRVPAEYANGTIRFSFGQGTTPEEIRQLAGYVRDVILSLN